MSFFDIVLQKLGSPSISILLQALVNQYLFDSYCLTLVLEKPIDFNINISFTYITSVNGTKDELATQLLEVSEKGCSDYIVYMRDTHKFMSAFDQTSHRGNARRSNRKIIFLPFASNAEYVDESLELFSMKESTFVANILQILLNNKIKTDCEVYDLVTHEFVSLFHDQPLYLDQWDSCTQTFVKNINLFPHDLKNLNGRVVRVACFNYEPNVWLDLDPAVVPSQRDGLDIRLVDEFCRWVNCTIEIVDESEEQWGEMFENGTGTGIIGAVTLDQADMGIDGIYPWYEEYVNMDFSVATLKSAVTCLAPSPRIITSWEMPLRPFGWSTWCAVLLTFVFASVVLIAAKGSTDRVFLTIFGMILSQSQPDDGILWRIRSITGWILGASLIIVSAYGAGLASTFTVPKYEPSIDTVQDLVDRNMEWGATHDVWIYSYLLSTEPLVKQLVSQFKVYSVEELKRRSFTRNLAFGIEKMQSGSYAIGKYVTEEALQDLTIMLEEFYFGHTVVLMRKSSIYTEKISNLIGRLQETGLLLAWEKQVSLLYQDFKVQQKVRLSRSKMTESRFITALGLYQVVGVYIAYLLGVGLATLVFLIECCVRKKTRKAAKSSIELADYKIK